MKPDEIIRAWKDEQYRIDLGAAGGALVPASPAGSMELTDEDLGAVGGGTTGDICVTISISIMASDLMCASIMHGTCSGFSLGCC